MSSDYIIVHGVNGSGRYLMKKTVGVDIGAGNEYKVLCSAPGSTGLSTSNLNNNIYNVKGEFSNEQTHQIDIGEMTSMELEDALNPRSVQMVFTKIPKSMESVTTRISNISNVPTDMKMGVGVATTSASFNEHKHIMIDSLSGFNYGPKLTLMNRIRLLGIILYMHSDAPYIERLNSITRTIKYTDTPRQSRKGVYHAL